MPSENNHRRVPQRYEEFAKIITTYFHGQTIVQAAAEELATATLYGDGPDGDFGQLWSTCVIIAYDCPDDLEKLADLLVCIASLPPLKNGEEVWSHMPTLGWDLNAEWNALSIPKHNPQRQEIISQFLNINTLCAHLLHSQHPSFTDLVDLFALWTFRSALEESSPRKSSDAREAMVPAARVWISIAGKQIFELDRDFAYGGNRGDPGGGGELWSGRHGFCRERWMLWKSRFGELAKLGGVAWGVKQVAREAAREMEEVEKNAE